MPTETNLIDQRVEKLSKNKYLENFKFTCEHGFLPRHLSHSQPPLALIY